MKGSKSSNTSSEELKTVKRKEVAEKIKVALSFGDLSENSEYDEAKNDQAIIEGRIAEIENQLKNVKVLDESEISTESVHIGSTVKVKDLEDGSVMTYRHRSDRPNPIRWAGRISDESPVGKALLGHRTGEQVEVEIPNGTMQYMVMEISK